jgi:hypothetical protein
MVQNNMYHLIINWLMSILRLIHLINKEIINNMFNIIINKFKIMNNNNDNNISNQADNKIINKLMKLNININKNNLDNNNNLDINWSNRIFNYHNHKFIKIFNDILLLITFKNSII